VREEIERQIKKSTLFIALAFVSVTLFASTNLHRQIVNDAARLLPQLP